MITFVGLVSLRCEAQLPVASSPFQPSSRHRHFIFFLIFPAPNFGGLLKILTGLRDIHTLTALLL